MPHDQQGSLPRCLDIENWRASTPQQITLHSFFAITRSTRQLRHGQEFSEQQVGGRGWKLV